VDEKTGMQARERLHESKPVRPGLTERIEFEYRRHGTLCLIANFDVATGKLISPSIGPTRSEKDFAAHIEATLDTDPQAGWVFVADQLNTHYSATLVKLIAKRCGIKGDLGEKGKSGILHSSATRRAFLRNTEHRIRFVYTPRHCSWLNQVEIWFSILARRLPTCAGESWISSTISTMSSASLFDGPIPADHCKLDGLKGIITSAEDI
jgi:hypothetical protein